MDSLVVRFQGGAAPDKIAASFPTLKLSQIYGVIAYYPENERAVNEYSAEGEREAERSAVPLSQANSEFFSRLEVARRQMASKQL